MSATERLRRLLDERWVEYEAPHAGFTIVRMDKLVCKYYETLEEPERGVFAVVTTDYLTPEQAIAATLGPGTCHDTHEARWFRCSACGFGIEDMYVSDEYEYPPEDQPKHCPNCGRLVVEVDE